MNLSFKTPKKPELKSRLALRNSKWKVALPFFEESARANEQDYAQWNLLGDIQYRSGDIHSASISWQRALDGYAHESLHENVLGIGRKMTKRCPEESGVYRLLSEAYLGLEYYSDAISTFRSFVKLSRSATSTEKKGWFRKVMASDVRHPHLLEELTQLYDECEFEDIELQREIQAYVMNMQENSEVIDANDQVDSFEQTQVEEARDPHSDEEGLMSIDGDWSGNGVSFTNHEQTAYQSKEAPTDKAALPTDFEAPDETIEENLPNGQGKDHYDLGIVYAEMKLWDAAITELQTARRDKSIRTKATIELAQCLKSSNDPRRALKLLEDEVVAAETESEVQDELSYHMGMLHQALGNVEAAVTCLEKVSSNSTFGSEATSLLSRLRAQQ